MTEEEARKVAAVVEKADGGCRACAQGLIYGLNAADLGWHWVDAEDWWDREDGNRIDVMPCPLS